MLSTRRITVTPSFTVSWPGSRVMAQGPLVAAAVHGPVVDHVDGFGGVHAAVAAVGGGVLGLDVED